VLCKNWLINVSVPIQESEGSCICVLGVMYMRVRGIDFACISTNVQLIFGHTSLLLFVFHFVIEYGYVIIIYPNMTVRCKQCFEINVKSLDDLCYIHV